MRDLTPNVRDCALAFEGGGYRETFSAGIATVLMDVGIRFGYVCGISAGSSNTVDSMFCLRSAVTISFLA